MREATDIARINGLDRTVETFSKYRDRLTVPENAEVYVRGLQSYKSLSDVDRVRFRAIIEEYFFAYGVMLERQTFGTYDTTTWNVQINIAASLLKQPGGSEWWEDRKHIYNQELIAAVESAAVAETP
jgi:hypothetical protein